MVKVIKVYSAERERKALANYREIGKSLEERGKILDARYKECGSVEHRAPSREENRCGYCYRTLEIITEADRILKSRRGLPIMQQPLDAPWIRDKRDKEIDFIRVLDYAHGLKELAEERERLSS